MTPTFIALLAAAAVGYAAYWLMPVPERDMAAAGGAGAG